MPALDIMQKTQLDTDQADGNQGRGAKPAKRRGRPRDPDKAKKGSGHKLTLPPDVFRLLTLNSIEQGRSMSAIAAEILEEHLPRLWIAGPRGPQSTTEE
jgi:hypothetical protein